MSPPVRKVVVLGRDVPLWLAAGVLRKALAPSAVEVEAVELPSHLGEADVHVTLPPLEALHNQLLVDEARLLRATQGCFSLGQNFVGPAGGAPGFLHAYGCSGTRIDGRDFFPYWLKARRLGLRVGLEDFSLTAAAARQGRLMVPNEETEVYGRSDYGYHLPAQAYARSLAAIASHHGVVAHAAKDVNAVLDPDNGSIAALELGEGRRVEGDLFIDASGFQGQLINAGSQARRESWRAYFPADRIVSAAGARIAPAPVYAEIRAWEAGWAGLYPSRARTHVVQAYSSALCSDEHALRRAAAVTGLELSGQIVRASDPGRRASAWEANCVAIGEAACAFDPVHNVDLHAVQLGLVHLLACFPTSRFPAAQQAEYNRLMHSSFERLRDFQAAHYALNLYGASSFWTGARQAPVPRELAHRIATFRARGEVAPFEEESFLPDSWRSLFIGHGLEPESYLPTIDRTPPQHIKAEFQRMLGFVKEQVLRQPEHNQYLDRISARAHG